MRPVPNMLPVPIIFTVTIILPVPNILFLSTYYFDFIILQKKKYWDRTYGGNQYKEELLSSRHKYMREGRLGGRRPLQKGRGGDSKYNEYTEHHPSIHLPSFLYVHIW